ncbi:uncharacterized protein UV8b_06860 [Ustilaginoidea virens]|uniref:Uncharacterized protein n=1 Tax=Ustilaginoidea virens TaxID=1159556 RepID=A0A8E5HWP1_USTVR|nr:uncharacterized protein UV8b_06860 [Ustilaginoidea virens]QUC22619.1 hypothetical protein UV8b_06860 [Ustilaginoidea virens]
MQKLISAVVETANHPSSTKVPAVAGMPPARSWACPSYLPPKSLTASQKVPTLFINLRLHRHTRIFSPQHPTFRRFNLSGTLQTAGYLSQLCTCRNQSPRA